MIYLPDIPTILEDLLRPRVEKGAAWLDEHVPGWATRIQAKSLNLAHACDCVLGQLYGHYCDRPRALSDAPTYGFNVPTRRDMFPGVEPNLSSHVYEQLYWACFSLLDGLWLEEIAWRRS